MTLTIPSAGRGALAAASLLLCFPLVVAEPQQAAAADARAFQALALPDGLPERFEVDALIGEQVHTLHLEAHSVRGPGAIFYAQEEGGELVPFEPPPPTTYRGVLAGRPESRVAASLSPDGLRAFIVNGPGERTWSIEPVGNDRIYHTARRNDELTPIEGACGVLYGPDALPPQERRIEQNPPISAADSLLLICEVAYDVTNAGYLACGGTVAGALDQIETILNASSVIYEYWVGVRYEFSGGIIRTDLATDPYAGFVGSACDLVRDVDTQWDLHHGDIPRDVAHAWTDTVFTQYIGCANYNGICNFLNGFGVSDLRFDFHIDAELLSHEFGHNWNLCHCNDGPGAEDPCAEYDVDDCGIMWSGIFGGTSAGFGANSLAKLQAQVASETCLSVATAGSPAPTLTSVNPSSVTVLDGGTVTLNGDDFDSVLLVHVDGSTFDAHEFGYTDSQTLTVAVPDGTALGTAPVSVSGPGGTSAVVNLTYVETVPPKVVSEFPITLIPGLDNTWTFGGPVGSEAHFVMSYSDSTTSVGGFDVLASPITLDVETLTGIGVGDYTRFIGTQLLGVEFWVQVLCYDQTGALIGVSAPLYNKVGL